MQKMKQEFANTKHQTGDLLQPRDVNMKIWRYMDLTKLVAFLETGSLYFARVDTFGDPYEGSWTQGNMADRKSLTQEMLDEGINCTPETVQKDFENFTHFWRESTYINCWHSGETESAAMWNLYGTTTGSIVIQSTYKKLMDALPERVFRDEVYNVGRVYMGMVQYKDYNSSEDSIPSGNMMYPFLHKRKEFEYEKEVRALIWNNVGRVEGDDPPGIAVDIDIDKVVETIRAQPTTPAWARESIEKLLERYGWGKKVMPSQIDTPPTY